MVVDELDGVHRRVVGDLHALGLPGGSRGEQHVGQVVRGEVYGLEMLWITDDLGIGDGQVRQFGVV